MSDLIKIDTSLVSSFRYASIKQDASQEDIEIEISRLKNLRNYYANKDSAYKIIINSIYGVVGFTGFICYDKIVAESVTAQSQDIIKYSMRIVNEYFRDWHNKTDIHQKMGITKIIKITHDVVNYADTDSLFSVLDIVYESSGFNGDFVDFVMVLLDLDFRAYIEQKLYEYVDSFNGYQKKPDGSIAFKLELEEILNSTYWLGKKKYIKDPIWSKGKKTAKHTKLSFKGIEINQSSYSEFVRGKLKKLCDLIITSLDDTGVIDTMTLVKELRSIRDEFYTTSVDNISKTERISDYGKYVVNDVTGIETISGSRPQHKGAAQYNYSLNNSKYKNKYPMIKSGSKTNWYYVSGGKESFAYPVGGYPPEIAPPIDVLKQFDTLILQPINNIIEASSIPRITASLVIQPTALW